MIKEVVILAGGEGKRLKESLKDEKLKELPKPLVPVLGKPIIKYCIDAVYDYVEKIIIVINPNKEKYFEEIKNDKIVFTSQEKPLGTANALYCAKDFIENDLFLVMMGDDIIIDDFEKILKINYPCVFGYEVEDVSNFGALIIKDGFLERIVEKELSGKGIANVGMYIMHKKFFEIYNQIPISSKGEYYLTEAPRILKNYGINFKVEKVKFWFPVNNYEELKKAEIFIEKIRKIVNIE
ncbi:MAG: nucleotidyltransferase family protein [Candidatus Aenigmatarchaeota archaeon]